MIYEIVNPSDPYTIDCPDNEIAVVACVLLGQGQYAFTALERDKVPDVPLMLFDGLAGADTWCERHLSEKFEPVLQRVLATRAADLATAMDSVLIGHQSDRVAFEDMASQLMLPPDQKRLARNVMHDRRRSSLNDIGGRAYWFAANLRKGKTTGPKAPRQVLSK